MADPTDTPKIPEMVERVALACAAARFGTTVDRLYWSQESEAWRRAHLDIAVAAIEAMREPTDAMDKAGKDAAGAEGAHDCEVPMSDVYRAMIDAAVAE